MMKKFFLILNFVLLNFAETKCVQDADCQALN